MIELGPAVRQLKKLHYGYCTFFSLAAVEAMYPSLLLSTHWPQRTNDTMSSAISCSSVISAPVAHANGVSKRCAHEPHQTVSHVQRPGQLGAGRGATSAISQMDTCTCLCLSLLSPAHDMSAHHLLFPLPSYCRFPLDSPSPSTYMNITRVVHDLAGDSPRASVSP